jgi:hypothetical protein
MITAYARHGRFRRLGAGVAIALVGMIACGSPEAPPRAPPPPAALPDPPGIAKMAQACAMVSACTHGHDGSPFRDPRSCIDWWLSEPDAKEPLRRCHGEAQTCDQISICVQGGGDTRAAAFCRDRPGVVSGCDGERLVSCGEDDSHPSTVVDCAAMGAACREVRAAGGLVVRACQAPQKCGAGAPETRCDGAGAVISCRDGGYERVACRPGTSCEELHDESGELMASCEALGHVRCDGRAPRRCQDDRLVECDRAGRGSKARVVDCVAQGLRCAGLGPRAACSVPNVDCDRALLPKCEGSSLVFCAAGRLTKLSCTSLGFAGCDPAARGSIAACSGQAGNAKP